MGRGGGRHLGIPGAHAVFRGSVLLGISASQTASTECSGKALVGFGIVDSSKRNSPDGVMKKRRDTSDILFFFLHVIIFKIYKRR